MCNSGRYGLVLDNPNKLKFHFFDPSQIRNYRYDSYELTRSVSTQTFFDSQCAFMEFLRQTANSSRYLVNLTPFYSIFFIQYRRRISTTRSGGLLYRRFDLNYLVELDDTQTWNTVIIHHVFMMNTDYLHIFSLIMRVLIIFIAITTAVMLLLLLLISETSSKNDKTFANRISYLFLWRHFRKKQKRLGQYLKSKYPIKWIKL